VDSGAIGESIGASAFMMGRGPESWHPNPEFFYKHGGGPVLDVGPYYFTALVAMLGPAASVSGAARASFPERVVGSGPIKGRTIAVEVPTHASGCVEFASGAIATYIMSFDVWHSSLPRIEVYGSEGSLVVPDPNFFGGPVLVRRRADPIWSEVPLDGPFKADSRGLGLAEEAQAIAEGRPGRASGELALHVLEIMLATEESARSGRRIELRRACKRPQSLGSEEAEKLSAPGAKL
jgi:predicted dehydrogenase